MDLKAILHTDRVPQMNNFENYSRIKCICSSNRQYTSSNYDFLTLAPNLQPMLFQFPFSLRITITPSIENMEKGNSMLIKLVDKSRSCTNHADRARTNFDCYRAFVNPLGSQQKICMRTTRFWVGPPLRNGEFVSRTIYFVNLSGFTFSRFTPKRFTKMVYLKNPQFCESLVNPQFCEFFASFPAVKSDFLSMKRF
jgi:hypothetical protein